MPRKKWDSIAPDFILASIKKAGFSDNNSVTTVDSDCNIAELDARLKQILAILDSNRGTKDMIFFVMYDIENDKVRNLIAKYLIAQGCIRIQNSVFIAEAAPEHYQCIKKDLKDVQQAYRNNDSIVITPLSAENLSTMSVIGKALSPIHNMSKNVLPRPAGFGF